MSDAATTKRVCIFCGDTPVTREHVWPQWLSREEDAASLHESDGDNWRTVKRFRPHSQTLDVDDEWELQISSIAAVDEPKGQSLKRADHVVRAACGPCNSGWMARLEDEVRPVLLRQMRDRRHRLNASERNVLTRWLAKTTAVFEMDDPQSAVLPEDVRHSLRRGELVGLWKIDAAWTRRHAFHMAHGRAYLTRWPDEVEPKWTPLDHLGQSMLQIIRVGHAAYVIEFRTTDRLSPRSMRGRRIQIWPKASVRRRPILREVHAGRMADGRYTMMVRPSDDHDLAGEI